MPARVSPAPGHAFRPATPVERVLRGHVRAPVLIPVVVHAVLLGAAAIASTTTRLPSGTLLAGVAVGGFLAALAAAHRTRTAVTALRRTLDDAREADLDRITEAARALDRSVGRALRELDDRGGPDAPEHRDPPTPGTTAAPAPGHLSSAVSGNPGPAVPEQRAPAVSGHPAPAVPGNRAPARPERSARAESGPSRTVDVPASCSADPAARVVGLLDELRVTTEAALVRVRDEARPEIVRRTERHLTQRQLTLVGRALHALSAVQWLTDEPVLLDEIYRVDHLVTRIRRLVESRAVLGAEPLRRGRRPIDVTTVLRGAVSEVAQYPRAIVEGGPDGTELAVPGHVGPDLAHLLAELIDNACDNSDPATLVHVRARKVDGGLEIEVEDRAVPMSPQRRERMNALLRDPEGPAAAEQVGKGQIGLLTAAKIARRHGVGVHLLAHAWDGTTALVTVPDALLVPAWPPAAVRVPLPLRSVGPGPDLLSGRSGRTYRAAPPLTVHRRTPPPHALDPDPDPAPDPAPEPVPADVPLPRRPSARQADAPPTSRAAGRADLAAAFRRDPRTACSGDDGTGVPAARGFGDDETDVPAVQSPGGDGTGASAAPSSGEAPPVPAGPPQSGMPSGRPTVPRGSSDRR
ncbi:ATP-binding protein [Streptomyces sp. ACT015]|uniref:sensor histidine kinase n=1 Tax=Streptomyces sp. ACT015 TaxID=3134807 RepID=UPI003D16A811